ncbi:MAG: hypothetical protein HC884_16420 [Chloroflexaceae bacterium]|nr:hypothetical protein [Chloroflexaceae bacterium]
MMKLSLDRLKRLGRLSFEWFKMLWRWLVVWPAHQFRRGYSFLVHLPRTARSVRSSLRAFYRQWVRRPLVHLRWALRKSSRAVQGSFRSGEGFVQQGQQWIVRPTRWGYRGVLALWRLAQQGWQTASTLNWQWLADLRWMDRPLLRTRWMLRRLNRRTRGNLRMGGAFFSQWFIRPFGQLVQWPFTASQSLRQVFQACWQFTTVTLRQVVGWPILIIGAITAPMPIPTGLPLIVIGILMIGPGDPRIRWMRVQLQVVLRKWSRQGLPIISPTARTVLQFGNRIGSVVHPKKRRVEAKERSVVDS